jgi:HAD domain in Swiss Army Knife RNA repair proteins
MPAVVGEAHGVSSQQGSLILDLDDTLCLSNPYGGYHARAALLRPAEAPRDIWVKLFHRAAVDALQELMAVARPKVALSTSWLAIMDRPHFVEVFRRTGLGALAESFHEHWDIQQNLGVSRHDAISAWLEAHHRGEPLLILDDPTSGESLIESVWDAAGHQILCEVDRGFHAGLLPKAIEALRTPYVKPLWW